MVMQLNANGKNHSLKEKIYNVNIHNLDRSCHCPFAENYQQVCMFETYASLLFL